MDNSETYIKMMIKAWPDLKNNMPIYSLLFSRRQRMLYILDGKVVHYHDSIDTSNSERAIPLLEQDQLQEMLSYSAIGQLPRFNEFVHKLPYLNDMEREARSYFTSMEQLRLAFVMKDEHNKVWNGEEWVDA